MAEQVKVPDDDAGEDELFEFAKSYDAYQLHGADLQPLVRSVQERWERTGELSDDVDVLRACLLSVLRDAMKWRGSSYFGIRYDRDPFAVALVARIRELTGGFVSRKPEVN